MVQPDSHTIDSIVSLSSDEVTHLNQSEEDSEVHSSESNLILSEKSADRPVLVLQRPADSEHECNSNIEGRTACFIRINLTAESIIRRMLVKTSARVIEFSAVYSGPSGQPGAEEYIGTRRRRDSSPPVESDTRRKNRDFCIDSDLDRPASSLILRLRFPADEAHPTLARIAIQAAPPSSSRPPGSAAAPEGRSGAGLDMQEVRPGPR